MKKRMISEFRGVVTFDIYDNENVQSCVLKEENIFNTEYGMLIPQYSASVYGERQKKYRDSISFYTNGNIKSVALEKQLPIKTPLGDYQAELVTFYEDGRLRRLFPLNGKIDGFWSEEDEGARCEIYDFDFSFGSFKAKIIGLNFYQSGALKSITLWPGEVIELLVQGKIIPVRNGISLYEDGSLKSVEPDVKVLVNTPIGEIYAYDKDAIGIHGDTNSLIFSKKGVVIGLTTTSSGIKVKKADSERIQWLQPLIIDSIVEDDEKTILPLKIQFGKEIIKFTDDFEHTFSTQENEFSVYLPMLNIEGNCSDCSSCSSCG